MAVDLHIHSTASDGTLTPEQIVEEARRIGLTAIAIADHDELGGLQAARQAAGEAGLPLIPAVEINADYGQTEVHVLGYWVDPEDAVLQRELQSIREARLRRAERMTELLRESGVRLELEDVLRAAGGGSVGRPHVAAALVEAGVCQTPQQAFNRYIGKGRSAYVPRERPSVTQALDIVRRTGACPVLAHPGLVAGHPNIIEQMARSGIEGVEAYHPKHSPARIGSILKEAEALGLLVTGGSDSHGPRGTDPVPIGAGDVPDSCVEALQEWRKRRDG